MVKLQGLLKVLRPVPTLIAIPTTAGAGSETTVAAVITDSATHCKASVNDPFLIPKYAVLDPTLTASLPPYTTATTGMDALAHAVEAFTNRTTIQSWKISWRWRRCGASTEACCVPLKTEMNGKMGIPNRFPQIKTEDIPQMAAWADKEANPLYPVPVIWTKTDLESFIANMK